MKEVKPEVGDYLTSFRLIMHNDRALLITSFERNRETGVRPLIYEITSDPTNFGYSPGGIVLPGIPTIEELSYWLYCEITKVDGICCFLHSDIDDDDTEYLIFTTDETDLNIL